MDTKLRKIINDKLSEHTNETDATLEAIVKAKQDIKDNKDIHQAQNLMILKDKMMFHKACAMILQDVLDTYNKENS